MMSCGRLIQLAILLALSTATHCGFLEGGFFPILEPRAAPDAPDGYTPARVPCPKTRPAIRQATSLSTEETSWLELRDNSTFPALEEFLTRATIGGIDIEAYLNGIVSNGIAISGGGYRAMINGAGAIAAFDNRTTGSTRKGQLGGILQATTYLSGLSGGSWVVGSLYVQNFTTVESIIYGSNAFLGSLWQLDDSIFEGPNNLSVTRYYRELYQDVQGKVEAGYNKSITDYWGRSLSYQLVNASDGGPDAMETVAGADNAGFVMGTSASLFNQAFLQIQKADNVPEFLLKAINNTLADIGEENRDIANWPNPFYKYNPKNNSNADSTILTLVDGGEDLQNVPFHPLLVSDRQVDVIFAIDGSADTKTRWPNGTSLVATYERSKAGVSTQNNEFPKVPDQNTFINLGLNKQPTFFGCDTDSGNSSGPLIVYLPNAPYSYESNFTTFDLEYSDRGFPDFPTLLRQLGFGATGTARPNCGITTEMRRIKETGKASDGMPLKYNEVILIPTEDQQVIQIAWKDSGVVLFLSTVHSGASHGRTLKKRKLPAKRGTKAEAQQLQQIFNGDSFKMIPIPTVAAQYNDEMNHVDRGDQIRSYTTYEHRFRRGPWQALLWSFLLEVALANSFILQKNTRHPRWKPYSTLQAWKECICNAIFNRYAAESGTRKRYRSGKEEDIEDIEARQIHLQRDINHVNRGRLSPCLACKGLRQGQPRLAKKNRAKGGYLQPISGNARGPQSRYGCKVCDVVICNNADCWYFYHTLI
ncbi:lysophospholipase [Fusarium oxysporum f. sp. phaseoli]